ncbi:tetratricopeptide repeat protein [Desulfurispira natronophila]|uniref:TolA-binding protein n=1 Tax=Desulfurispira natronophila TaxID=682562 RepID=A0A7W8DHP4_9BACT|nr:tetratricopeptide repeat protein [Desulfurispira natronophila]MBB5022786.1 TolA-binding protein [Desulfurispira natronophila]
MAKIFFAIFLITICSTASSLANDTLPPVELDRVQVGVVIKPDTIVTPLFVPQTQPPGMNIMAVELDDYTESAELMRRPLEYQVLVERPGGCLFSSRFGAAVGAAMSDEGKIRAARLHYTTGNYQQAINVLEKVGSSSAHYPISLYLQALSWKEKDNLEKSDELFGRAARSSSPEVAAESSLALAISRYNQADMEYIKMVERYIQIRSDAAMPPVPRLLHQIALYDQGDFQSSIEAARHLESTSVEPTSMYFKAHAFERVQQPEKALESYYAAYELGVDAALNHIIHLEFEDRNDEAVVKLAQERLDLVNDTIARYSTISSVRLGNQEKAKYWHGRIISAPLKAATAYDAYIASQDQSLRDHFAQSLVRHTTFEHRNEAYLLLAEHYLNTGRYQESLRQALEHIVVSSLSRENRRAYYLFTLINHNQLEQYREAQNTIAAGRDIFNPDIPHYDLWVYESAKTALLIGNLERASQLYDAVGSDSTYYPSARFHRANLLTLRERYKEAEKIYKELIELNFRPEDVRIQLAILYNNWGKFKLTLETVDESTGPGVQQRGHALLKLGRFSEAIRSYYLCRQHFHRQTEEHLECTYFQALSSFNNDDYHRAIIVLENYFDEFQASPIYRERAIRLVGDAYYNEGNYDRAQEYYQQIANERYHSGYFSSLMMQNQVEDVREYVEQHSESMSRQERQNAHVYLSRRYIELGDLDQAQEYALQVGNEDAIVGFVRHLVEHGNHQQALNVAGDHHDQFPSLRYYMGLAHYRQGNYNESLRHMRAMVDHSQYKSDALHYGVQASLQVQRPDVMLLMLEAEETNNPQHLAQALPILMEQEDIDGTRQISRALLFTYTSHRDLAGYAFAWSFESSDPERAIVEYLKVTYLHQRSPYVRRSYERLYELYQQTGQPERAAALQERKNQGANQ